MYDNFGEVGELTNMLFSALLHVERCSLPCCMRIILGTGPD